MPSGSQPLRSAVLALLLVAAVGVAAVAVTDESGPAGDTTNESFPSGENISERYNSLDGVVGAVRTTTTRGDETNTTVRLVKTRPGTAMRYVRQINGTGQGPDVVVSNGSATWRYDRNENTVTRLNSPYTTAVDRGASIERLFARLDRTQTTPVERDVSTATPGVAPVPQVPQGRGVVPVGRNATHEQFGVSYEGYDTVAGRETYVLRVATGKNASERAGNFTQTLWIDTEHYFLLGRRIEGTIDGERFVASMRYLNVTFDPGLSDDAFRFAPPPGATVQSVTTPSMRTYDSVAALQADAELVVPRPAVPRYFAFSVGRRAVLERSRLVSIRYVNDTSTITVTTFNRTLGSLYDDTDNRTAGVTVQVGDHEGIYRTFGLSKSISWSCAGHGYAVSGSGITRELLLRVAVSIECPQST